MGARGALVGLAGLAAAAVVGAAGWTVAAGAAPPPAAWAPAPRDLRHVDSWVLAGERQSAEIGRSHADVLFVGDSITQWWTRYGRASWDAYFAPLGAADDGVAGDTTSNVLARLDSGSVQGLSPRVAVLLIGTNNIPLHQSPPDIARGIRSVVADLSIRLPRTRILLLGLLPRDQPGRPDRRAIEAVNGLIQRTPGVTYLDIGSWLLDDNGRFLPGVMHDDLLHPAPAGYARMAAAIGPAVRTLLAYPTDEVGSSLNRFDRRGTPSCNVPARACP